MKVKGDVDTEQSEPGRPTRSANEPSRYRDGHFETQFRPGTKKKVRQVHFNPGKEEPLTVGLQAANRRQKARVQERCQALGKEEQWQALGKEEQKSVRKDDSSWTGQTRSSLVRQTECSSPQNRPSLSLGAGPGFGRPIRPKPRLKHAKLNRHPVRFKSNTHDHKLSRETSRFRTLSRSSLTRFRPWHALNTQVFKKQQQLLRVRKAKWPYKLSRGTSRFRILSQRCSVRFRPYAPFTNQSDNVKDVTSPVQVAGLHHSSSGNVENGSQKNVRNKAKMLRHSHGLIAITNKLPSASHSAGAQTQCQSQARRTGEESHAESPINGGQQRPITATRAASKGVNWTPQSEGDKRSLARRRVEAIKRRGTYQVTDCRTSWANQYHGVRHLLLYAHWQANRPQLSPIIKQGECPDGLPPILPISVIFVIARIITSVCYQETAISALQTLIFYHIQLL